MLTIVTGLPGAGKTLFTLSKLIGEYRGRAIYVYGIPGIDHEYFGTSDLEDPTRWFDLEEGAVVVIDEAQKVFPVRKVGSEVPRKCQEFETHRHRGFDIVLLTQDATTLDVHIRKLAGRHIHVHRLFGGKSANIYEYPSYEQKPTDRNTRRAALSVKTWKYDQSIFDHYKSADLHTVKRKIPAKMLVLPILAVAFLGAMGFAVWGVMRMVGNPEERVDQVSVESGESSGGGLSGKSSQGKLTAADLEARSRPVIAGVPWTAPMYSEVFQVRTFPKPYCLLVGDIQENSRADCRCYTQQLTQMLDIDPKVCRQIAWHGWFDPTAQDRRERSGRGSARAQPLPARRQSEFPGFVD